PFHGRPPVMPANCSNRPKSLAVYGGVTSAYYAPTSVYYGCLSVYCALTSLYHPHDTPRPRKIQGTPCPTLTLSGRGRPTAMIVRSTPPRPRSAAALRQAGIPPAS